MSVHFADSNSKWVWLNKKGCILIWISLMFVLGGPKDYNIFCVHAMVGCKTSLLNNRQSCSLSNSVFGLNKISSYNIKMFPNAKRTFYQLPYRMLSWNFLCPTSVNDYAFSPVNCCSFIIVLYFTYIFDEKRTVSHEQKTLIVSA